MSQSPIYLVVLHKTICSYERALLKELLAYNKQHCALYILDRPASVINTNAVLAAIDCRLLTLKVPAMQPYTLDHIRAEFPALQVYHEGDVVSCTTVICLADTKPDTLPLTYRKAYRPDMDYRHWYDAAICKELYTNIRLSSCTPDSLWETSNELSFVTVKGIYNNRDKALYYLTYLVMGQIRQTFRPVHVSRYPSCTLWTLLTYYLQLSMLLLSRKLKSIYQKCNWKVAVINRGIISIIGQPAGSFWADPFLITEGEKHFVFFEELDQHTGKGHISVVALDKEYNKSGTHKIVLEKPFHLSFPNVFKQDGQYYMMPEQSNAGKLSIYKATRFPFEWETAADIIDGIQVLDPIWLFHDGKYWLFFNKIEEEEYNNNERLYIYYSDNLFSGEWTPHARNPVIIDMHKARNAGQIFEREGTLFRPSQNCSDTYGSEIMINRIVRLNTEEYEEEAVEQLSRYNKYLGMHTFNGNDRLQVTDLLMKD